jgi:hypothetical protein
MKEMGDGGDRRQENRRTGKQENGRIGKQERQTTGEGRIKGQYHS